MSRGSSYQTSPLITPPTAIPMNSELMTSRVANAKMIATAGGTTDQMPKWSPCCGKRPTAARATMKTRPLTSRVMRRLVTVVLRS